jgi:hypothetical protein
MRAGDLRRVLSGADELISLSMDFVTDKHGRTLAGPNGPEGDTDYTDILGTLADKATPLRCLHLRGGDMEGSFGVDDTFVGSLSPALMSRLYRCAHCPLW